MTKTGALPKDPEQRNRHSMTLPPRYWRQAGDVRGHRFPLFPVRVSSGRSVIAARFAARNANTISQQEPNSSAAGRQIRLRNAAAPSMVGAHHLVDRFSDWLDTENIKALRFVSHGVAFYILTTRMTTRRRKDQPFRWTQPPLWSSDVLRFRRSRIRIRSAHLLPIRPSVVEDNGSVHVLR